MSKARQLGQQAFLNFFKYYRGEPHQVEAVLHLWEDMPDSLLLEDSPWVVCYRTAPEPPAATGGISEAGLDLIKEFEGLRLEAYLCPAGVWTIGWGHTKNVSPDDTITTKQAEEYLRQDLAVYEDCVHDLIKVTLTQGEFDALVSFAYNCGCGALQDSTMRRRLNAGEDKETVFRQELPKWVRGGGQTLPGLVRRRNAEIALALS